jgi:hypothetical protein
MAGRFLAAVTLPQAAALGVEVGRVALSPREASGIICDDSTIVNCPDSGVADFASADSGPGVTLAPNRNCVPQHGHLSNPPPSSVSTHYG